MSKRDACSTQHNCPGCAVTGLISSPHAASPAFLTNSACGQVSDIIAVRRQSESAVVISSHHVRQLRREVASSESFPERDRWVPVWLLHFPTGGLSVDAGAIGKLAVASFALQPPRRSG